MAYQELIANFFTWSYPDKLKQTANINKVNTPDSTESAVSEFLPQRRSLPSLFTGFGVPVAVRIPAALSPLYERLCHTSTSF